MTEQKQGGLNWTEVDILDESGSNRTDWTEVDWIEAMWTELDLSHKMD